MLQLDWISIEGFKVFLQTQTLKFLPGLTFILGKNLDSPRNVLDNNGSGKTTLLDAISWVLFCHTPEGKGGVDFQSHRSPFVEVQLKLKSPEQDLLIRRKFKGSRHEVELSIYSRTNPEKIGGDVDVVQARINKEVGCNWHLFNSVLYLSRLGTSAQFLFLAPVKRALVLSNLVDDSYFQIGAKILGMRIQEAENLAGAQAAELMTLRTHRDVVGRDIQAAEQARGHWEESEKLRSGAALAQFNQANSALIQVSKDLMEARLFLQANELANLTTQYQQGDAGVRGLEGDVRVAAAALARLPSRLHLEQYREGCPTCGQPIGEKCIQELELERLAGQSNLRLLEQNLEAARHTHAGVAELLARVQQNGARVREMERQAETLHQQAHHFRDQSAPLQPHYIEGQIEELRGRWAACQSRIEELERLLVDTSEKLGIMKETKRAFSGDVRNLMFDLIRGPLEEWTHHYVERLIDTGLTVEFPHQNVKEKFEIFIWNKADKQELYQYSGGERWRVAIAILLALRKVLSLQHGCKLDFLLIDDPAGELDDAGIAETFQVFQELTQEGIGSILLTVPRASYLPACHYNSVEVTRQHDHASITSTS